MTISALALLVHGFRQLAVKLSGNKTPPLWQHVGWATLAIGGRCDFIGCGAGDVEQCGACWWGLATIFEESPPP
ncbi:Uncharacterised protein [Raoultella planticola]|uniref:Uncharacterized protein n=1 Tax=Raoultella planticola TaxID=575 RepID=A0A485C1S7_RAOPL|nr:Uncharacterised protein [Raoultella planticola]